MDQIEMTCEAPKWTARAGEHLVVNLLPSLVIDRYAKLTEVFGLPEFQLASIQGLVSYPLPLVQDGSGLEPLARKITNFDALSHPMVWLKGEITRQHPYTNEAGDTVLESPEMVALRLAIMLEKSGLYDPMTGAWSDVTQMLNLDLNNPFDRSMIEQWQAGEPVDVLDNFTLDQHILQYASMEEYMARSTENATHVVVVGAWNSLMQALIGITAPDSDPRQSVNIPKMLAWSELYMIALESFASILADDPQEIYDESDRIGDMIERAQMHSISAAELAQSRNETITFLVKLKDDFFELFDDDFMEEANGRLSDLFIFMGRR